jgi:hypothetical protein
MANKKIVFNADNLDGLVTDLTAEEETQRQADASKEEADITAQATAKADNDALKASAKTKLMAGEALTEAEADTIVL